MGFLLKVGRGIDALNRAVASVVIWCCLVMIFISFSNSVLRRLGRAMGENLTWPAAMDLQWILFSVVFLLVGGYAMLTDSNVRVDLVYSGVSDRTKSMIDLVGCLLFALPFACLVVYMSWPFVVNSIAIMERPMVSGGVPPWIIKPLIPIAFALVVLQCLSMAIKHLAFLLGRGPNPHSTTSVYHQKTTA